MKRELKVFARLHYYYYVVFFYTKYFIKIFYRIFGMTFGLVNPWWSLKVNIPLLFTKKIKIGFGPVVSGEFNLSVRKWRIDPIINEINKVSTKYKAGYFFKENEMEKFDIIVIVKNFRSEYVPVISNHKKNKYFIYDIVDNPKCIRTYNYSYIECVDFTRLMNGFILSSPLQEQHIKSYSDKYLLIEHPIINHIYGGKSTRKLQKKQQDEIYILAQGLHMNISNVLDLVPILNKISKKTGKKIKIIYNSEKIYLDSPYVKYIQWSVKNSFAIMQNVDIAISIKKLSDNIENAKPSTKIIAFMAAGLPVVCTPTVADCLVIEDCVNGFFAYTVEDWERIITQLVQEPDLRRTIGERAKASVIEDYSINSITQKYIKLFDSVIGI